MNCFKVVKILLLVHWLHLLSALLTPPHRRVVTEQYARSRPGGEHPAQVDSQGKKTSRLLQRRKQRQNTPSELLRSEGAEEVLLFHCGI